MKTKTKELLAAVEAAHDWQEGQLYGGSGTQLYQTDVCRVCGLHRRWFTDPQNDVTDQYTFTLHDGREIPLRDAAALTGCTE